MKNEQAPDEVRKVAANFDKAVESKDIEKILSSFAEAVTSGPISKALVRR